MIKSKSKWLALIKDFNFNYVPSQLSFKADIFRQFGATRPRNVGGGPYKIPETYDKYYTFDRFYILQWNLTKSIALDFSATNNARVDEPFGRIDTEEKKDSVRKNLFKGGRNTQYASPGYRIVQCADAKNTVVRLDNAPGFIRYAIQLAHCIQFCNWQETWVISFPIPKQEQ